MNFNNLEIKKQVDFINKELKRNKKTSVTKLCKNLKIKKSTLIGRFKKEGYKFDFNNRQYIKNNNYDINVDAITSNCNTRVKCNINNNNTLDKNIMEELKKINFDDLKELLNMKRELKSFINRDEKLYIECDLFKGSLKPKVFKIYENIENDWIKFCKKNEQYKVQDLCSLALYEFIKKYKNY